MANTKFHAGDKVVIARDDKKDYGYFLELKGTITLVGAIRKGEQTYHVLCSDRLATDITVFESDLDFAE